MIKAILLRYLPFCVINKLRLIRAYSELFYYKLFSEHILIKNVSGKRLKFNSNLSLRLNAKNLDADQKWGVSFHIYKHRYSNQKKVKLMWADGPSPGNYGDWLSPYIVSSLAKCNIESIPDYSSPSFKHVLGVGSIAIKANHHSYVMGSGISSRSESLSPNARYFFVRGPHTNSSLIRAGVKPTEVMGDPGFFISKLIKLPKIEKSTPLILVRHQVHQYLNLIKPSEMEEVSINAATPDDIEKFIHKIATARLVITSAMHCYITCIAYRIPCVLINFSDSFYRVYGDGIKYNDAMEGVGLKPVIPLHLSNNLKGISFDNFVNYQVVSQSITDEIYKTFIDSLNIYLNEVYHE